MKGRRSAAEEREGGQCGIDIPALGIVTLGCASEASINVVRLTLRGDGRDVSRASPMALACLQPAWPHPPHTVVVVFVYTPAAGTHPAGDRPVCKHAAG